MIFMSELYYSMKSILFQRQSLSNIYEAYRVELYTDYIIAHIIQDNPVLVKTAKTFHLFLSLCTLN
jgi:hypothetical protein